uniref:Peter pan homolog n=1 Tax=Hippocampus comes TaxID=109280 RepID=A0A3Q3DJ16_HIPCM
MGKSKSKNQKKSRVEAHRAAEETYRSVPHSFVFHRGRVGKNVAQLITDVRRVMEPFTAEHLKVRKKNVLKDFVAVAGPIGVTHFIIFSKTLARLPKGPMLYFKVLKYTLVKDVVSSLKKHRMHGQQFTHHPLLILNNFGSDGMHIKLMATMFQNMFPSINVHKVSLNTIKRCVLLNYKPETQEIEFRHYSLKVVPLLCAQIGPRMTLQLIKIQDGISSGNIMYHATIFKTEEEIQEILQRKEDELKNKQERRKKQELNVAQKKLKKEAHKYKCLAGIKSEGDDKDSEVEDPGTQDERAAAAESDDEAEYYRQAVGEEPDEDMFPGAKRRRSKDGPQGPAKKMRKLSANKTFGQDKGIRRSVPGGHKDKAAKKFGERQKKPFGKKTFGEKPSPGGKPFKKQQQGGENRFGSKKKRGDNKRTFSGKLNKGQAFQRNSQKSKATANKKSDRGAKQSSKHKKKKG